jgi:hypothetical protein
VGVAEEVEVLRKNENEKPRKHLAGLEDREQSGSDYPPSGLY